MYYFIVCYTMTKTVMYTAAIATISVLLFTVLAFDAEAKTFDKEKAVMLKGEGIIVQGPPAMITVAANDDDKDSVSVLYLVLIPGKIAMGMNCTGSSDILKLSGMNKASLEFNTSDLDCGLQFGFNGDISLAVETTGDSQFLKYDDTFCNPTDEGEICNRIRGTSDGRSGVMSGTIFGESVEDVSGSISKINEKRTFWTTP